MRPAGAVVDVSNVCWSPRIPPLGRQVPLLSRLEAVRECWVRTYGTAAPLTLIGDRSLQHTLPPGDRHRLHESVRSGELRLVPYADPVLLALARDRGLHVISSDRFVDQRRDHPWIAGAADRFLSWTYDTADDTAGDPAGLRLAPSGIREVPEQDKSRQEEAKELSFAYRINVRDAAHRRVLRSAWRCTTPSCIEAMSSPDRLLTWPRLGGDGAVLCPSCRRPLEDIGPRGVTRVIVVADRAGGEIIRFPISENLALVIGRGRLPYGINLDARGLPFPRARARVSRQHVKLQMSGTARMPRLTAVDLASRNGTAIKRFGMPAERRLTSGEEVVVGDKDELLLGGAVLVRQSGHRFSSGLVLPELDDQGGSVTEGTDS
ncbi:hypothetical protein Misp01_60530 [Microtetraspora sp. NBRC 13810]|uniref:FHA domain-containing protein n=1 Tax=Microtetraspora sp. NBRC 13810 TaxID=3030990 RepID=UPI0024A4FA39|nr:FHA domain-containing protein [Microtetraspora sp. NBRC 13810]GLW10925.1 hypothetical protein Misp01_60530 [Microtetraspora sp. NBRC 13810]